MSHPIEKLLAIMAALREPETGCPWDLQQDYHSLTRYTLEEAYEVIETIEHDKLDELPGELGDLLFQVVFYAQLGKEQQRFDFADVVSAISDKLIRRHPHVFAGEQVADAEQQTRAGEAHKARERKEKATEEHRLMDGISVALPAMTRANKLQKRAAQVGFDWPDRQGVMDKIYEELEEVQQALASRDEDNLADELGDLLFSCINLVRHCQGDPETLLRKANARFQQRFNHMEEALGGADALQQSNMEQMDQAWEQAKRLD